MGRNNKRKEKRSKNLVLICTLTAVILIVSTYAWFIGLRSVSVASFDVEIASTDSLLLSLDGKKWSTQVNINKENFLILGSCSLLFLNAFTFLNNISITGDIVC